MVFDYLKDANLQALFGVEPTKKPGNQSEKGLILRVLYILPQKNMLFLCTPIYFLLGGGFIAALELHLSVVLLAYTFATFSKLLKLGRSFSA